MGADGYIPNPDMPVEFDLYCYTCKGQVFDDYPYHGHEKCRTEDGRLYVSFEVGNYKERG